MIARIQLIHLGMAFSPRSLVMKTRLTNSRTWSVRGLGDVQKSFGRSGGRKRMARKLVPEPVSPLKWCHAIGLLASEGDRESVS